MALRVLAAGGKGGTGKTFVAANLAYLAATRGVATLLVDADVGNPNAWVTLGAPEPVRVAAVHSFRPRILGDRCDLCGECVRACPAHALALIPGKGVALLESLCEGCALCLHACPRGAVGERRVEAGWISETSRGPLAVLVGELRPGERREEPVVEELLRRLDEAERGRELVVIDGPPGCGRLVRRLARRSHLHLCVAEPTPLSLNDLRRLVRILSPERMVGVLNKAGAAPGVEGEVRALFRELGVPWVEVPFSPEAARLYAGSVPVAEAPGGSGLRRAFEELLLSILSRRC